MRAALAGLILLSAVGSASAGEITPTQCKAIWQLVQFEARSSLVETEAIQEVWGKLVEATSPALNDGSPGFRARAALAAEIGHLLQGLKAHDEEVRTSTAVPDGAAALKAACSQ